MATALTKLAVIVALAMGVGSPARAKVRVTLPLLPQARELAPGLYDKDGCLVVAPKDLGRKCGPVPTAPRAPTEDRSPRAFRTLLGFVGPYYASEVEGTAVKVLEETLKVVATGKWQAAGLVRNETLEDVGGVVVTARLLGKGGALVGKAAATVPVALLRPGEPGPFLIAASADTAEVSRVEWSVEAGAAPPGVSRQFWIQQYWVAPYGARLYRDLERGDPPYPYLLAAGFRNLGGPLHDVTLVVSWLDDAGRVVWTETAPLDSSTVPEVPRGGESNFSLVRVFDAEVGHALASLTKILWAVGE